MSKLLDRLAALNRDQESSTVPPDIRVKVARDDEARRTRIRYLLGVAVCICAVLAGIGVHLYLDNHAAKLREVLQPLPPHTPSVATLTGNSTVRDKPVVAAPAATGATVAATGKGGGRPAPSARRHPKIHVRASAQSLARIADRGGVTADSRPATADDARAVPAPELRPPAPAVSKEVREAVLLAARTAEKRQSYGEALRIYLNALKDDPDNHCLLNNAASIHIRLREFGNALALCEKALRISGDYVPALVNQGIAHNALGRRADAAESFALALKLDPSSKEAAFNFALFNEKQGKLDTAIQAYERLSGDGDVEGMIGLARIYEKQSRKKEAVKMYVDIASRRDVPPEVRNTVINRLRQLGE